MSDRPKEGITDQELVDAMSKSSLYLHVDADGRKVELRQTGSAGDSVVRRQLMAARLHVEPFTDIPGGEFPEAPQYVRLDASVLEDKATPDELPRKFRAVFERASGGQFIYRGAFSEGGYRLNPPPLVRETVNEEQARQLAADAVHRGFSQEDLWVVAQADTAGVEADHKAEELEKKATALREQAELERTRAAETQAKLAEQFRAAGAPLDVKEMAKRLIASIKA